MDYNGDAFVSVPVFWVDGPLPACTAASVPSVKERPGGEAHSLQTDLDRVWLKPTSSRRFLPCCLDGRSLPPPPPPSFSFIHSLRLTRPINAPFVPALRSLCHSFAGSSAHRVCLPQFFCLWPLSVPGAGWRHLSLCWAPLFPVYLFRATITKMKTSVVQLHVLILSLTFSCKTCRNPPSTSQPRKAVWFVRLSTFLIKVDENQNQLIKCNFWTC